MMNTVRLHKLLNVYDYIDKEKWVISDYHLGCDGKLYIMALGDLPEPIQKGIGIFPNPHTDVDYVIKVISFCEDMTEVSGVETVHPEKTGIHYHFIRPLGEDILLLGARCYYDGEAGKGEENACVINSRGEIQREFCLGDGIAKVLTFQDRRIATGYFDEGIFGNYGWGERPGGWGVKPLGKSGLVVWDHMGNKLWENPGNDIVDVCSMEYDEDGAFWYYADIEYSLIHVDRSYRNTVYKTDTYGCDTILFDPHSRRILCDGGLGNETSFYTGVLRYGIITEKKQVRFVCDEEAVEIICLETGAGKVLAIGENAEIFIVEAV